MMKFMSKLKGKKFLAALLAAVLVLTALPGNYLKEMGGVLAVSANETDGENPPTEPVEVDMTPTTSGTISYGQPLSTLSINANTNVAGKIEWKNPDAVPANGSAQAWVFTPDDQNSFKVTERTTQVTVNKAAVSNSNTVTCTKNGSTGTLEDYTLSAAFTNPYNTNVPVSGTFSWDAGNTTTVEANKEYYWTFTSDNYENVTGKIIPYTASTFKVTYNANEGKVGTGGNKEFTITSGDEHIVLNAESAGISRDGFTFDSWNTQAGGTGTKYIAGGTFTPNSDTILYAQWKQTSFTVTYYPNGAAGNSSTDTASTPYVVKDPSKIGITRTGYTFTGWTTQANGGASYNAGSSITLTSNLTLYAQWKQNSLTVTYYSNGGTGAASHIDTVTANSSYKVKIASDINIIRTGYTFVGWTTQANGGTSYNAGSNITITSNLTLYAQWKQTGGLTITYDANGGTTSSSVSNKDTNVVANAYYTIKTIAATGITRSGYTFTGWNTRSDGKGSSYSPGGTFKPTANTILYAQWKLNGSLTITYDANGGATSSSVSNKDTNVVANTSYTIKTIAATGITRSGHTFTGWNTRSDGRGSSYSAGSTFMPTANTILYAQWKLNGSLTINYNANGGTGSYKDPNVVAKESYTVKTLSTTGITRSGYTFEGWNTKENGKGTDYSAGSTFKPTADMTLYAQWKKNGTITITYNANGGSGSHKDTGLTASETYTVKKLSATDITRSGYTFEGWNTKENGKGTNYSAGSTFKPTDDITLYAKWEKTGNLTITYNANGGSGGHKDTNVVANSTYTVKKVSSTDITRSGYTFDGWNTKSNGGGTNYSAGSTFKPSSDITLYAQWKQNASTTPATNNSANNAANTIANSGLTVNTPSDQPALQGGNGIAMLPGGGAITTKNGVVIDAPASTIIISDGAVGIPNTGTALVTLPNNNTRVQLPGGSTITANGEITVGSGGTVISSPAGQTFSIAEDSIITVDANSAMGFTVIRDMQFRDTARSDWYYNSVNFAYGLGIMNGTSESSFSPNTEMTRSMLVTVLWNMSSQETGNAGRFSDVAAGSWYADAVGWATANNVVSGYGNGAFGPNDIVTREQVAVIMHNYCQLMGYDVSASTNLSGYSDASKISPWALDAMQWANAVGLINGRSQTTLAPTGSATRAEVATIIYNFIESVR